MASHRWSPSGRPPAWRAPITSPAGHDVPRAAPAPVDIGVTGSLRPLPQRRRTRPIYSASGAITQPEEEYPDLLPIEIAIPRPRPEPARPAALDAATLLARALVEVLAGRRPLAQLRPHCTGGVYDALDDFPRLGPGPSLLSVWVCEPTTDRAEVSASFRCGGVTRALAMRLDDADRHWQITALQLA